MSNFTGNITSLAVAGLKQDQKAITDFMSGKDKDGNDIGKPDFKDLSNGLLIQDLTAGMNSLGGAASALIKKGEDGVMSAIQKM